MGKIRILIADDHPLVSIALKKVFEDYSDFEIVGEASDGEEAVRLTSELSPDVVIMDISMPKLTGLEATRKIKALCPDMLVMILTVHSDLEHIFGIFDAGADGYLVKTSQSEEIIQGVRRLIAGDIVLSLKVFKQVLRHGIQHPFAKTPSHGAIGKVSTREVEILSLASQGLGNKEIAGKMNISVPTVKNYFTDIFNKFNVNSRTEAVIAALRAGIITLDDFRQS